MISRLSHIKSVVVVATITITSQEISKMNRLHANCEQPSKEIQKRPLAAPPKIILYQFTYCPLCSQIKTFLDYNGLNYKIVEVNPRTKYELLESEEHKTKYYKDLPLAIIDDEEFQGCSDIIKVVSDKINVSESFYPSDTEKWSSWSTHRLRDLIYANVFRSLDESLERFKYLDDVEGWSTWTKTYEKYSLAYAAIVSREFLKKNYKVVDERKELIYELQVWMDTVGNKKFLHGNEITMPDLLVYGALKSIEGLQTFKLITKNDSILKAWFYRVDDVVAKRKSKCISKN